VSDVARNAVRLRAVLVAAQVATLLITWPLWQVRSAPPNLPALQWLAPGHAGALFGGFLFAFGAGWVLLGTLAAALLRPRWGIALHTAALVASMLLDQLRMQPQLISLTLLLWATLPGAGPALVGRAHLCSLYLWAGAHKLASADYRAHGGELWRRLGEGAGLLPHDGPAAATTLSNSLTDAMALGVALFEIALALCLVLPRTRRAAAWVGAAMHVGIFLALSPLGRDRNAAVWPWNLALAAALLVLMPAWAEPARVAWRRARPALRGVAAVLLLSPALFYAGLLDGYLSWCLYSLNVPSASFVTSEQRELIVARRAGESAGESAGEAASEVASEVRWPDLQAQLQGELHAPFPPATRLFLQYFRAVARPGDVLSIRDPRPLAVAAGMDDRLVTLSGELRHGKKEGPWTDRWPGGEVAAQGEYRGGERAGPWRLFDREGRLRAEGLCVGGRPEGEWVLTDTAGSTRRITCRQGVVPATSAASSGADAGADPLADWFGSADAR